MGHPTPTSHVYEVAKAVLGSSEHVRDVSPVIQKSEPGQPPLFPSVVYFALGLEDLSSFEGPTQRAEAVRIESRAKMYKDALAMDRDILQRLRAGGRLRSLGALIDEWDEEFEIHRRVRTVLIRT